MNRPVLCCSTVLEAKLGMQRLSHLDMAAHLEPETCGHQGYNSHNSDSFRIEFLPTSLVSPVGFIFGFSTRSVFS